ncbi:hypothetical protein [Chryseobacterium sp.]|uniref:hypothetical protein n=1 Tax=Chryseobacterium sp. TaxID=1871047 RepID=UPI002616660C|nr:hypothetical protein [Chryseobacterium sp.]
MKRNLFLRLCLIMTVALSLHSCRSEDFLQDTEKSKQDFKVSLLNRQQLDQQKPLLQELSELKSKFRYKNIDRKLGKSAQDDIFEGAIIGTNQVLLIEKNGNKTYTFPVYRTYMSDKTESLIVKENEDHTFSGILVQYDLTKEEKQQFLTGQNTEINSKIKIFDVDKLNINAKTNVDVIGCFVITWEVGWCSANKHYTGGPGGCSVGGAPAPMIQSIEYVCENGNPADNGESGESGSTGPVVGAGIDLGAYFSIPFISIGYQYYETEDDLDPNYLHYMSVVNYFSSLGTTLNQLRTANPDLFYYTFFYFKDNGINPTTKAFISQRLNGLNAWYVAAENSPNSISANNQYFLNWAYKYLVLNPDVTWEEFYEEYLATPCDNLSKLLDPTKGNLKPLITNGMYSYINNSVGEAGVFIKKDSGGNITTQVAPPSGDNTLQIKVNDNYYSAVHTHPKTTYPMFSYDDIISLYTLEVEGSNHNDKQSSFILVCEDDFGVKQTYAIVFENAGQMVEQVWNSPENIGCSLDELKAAMMKKYLEEYEKEENGQKNYERAFLRLNFGTNIGLYKTDPNLTSWQKLYIEADLPTATVKSTNCN